MLRERAAPSERAAPPPPRRRARRPPRPSGWGLAVAAVLLGALLVRIWGIAHGLPYAYNTDENAHFVPRAIGLFGHDLNPHYFVNPPAYTYLLHVVFGLWFGGRVGVSHAYATDPTQVYVVARASAAVLGTLAVGLLYLTGVRLFDRRVGLLAAGGLGVAFLPVFYAHLALNDAPTLAPICLGLWGSAGVLRHGRARDYAVAGLGLGLAAATKYTGGIVLLPLLGAAAVGARGAGGRAALRGLLLAGGLAVAGFVAADPYALLAPGEFYDGLAHQSETATDTGGKLGLTADDGILFYLRALTWGLGWAPALLALGAVGWLRRAEPRLLWVLVPAPVAFVLFMGLQGRFFGRWIIPVLPLVCLLAAYLALELAEWGARRAPRLRPGLLALAGAAVCGQGLVSVVHSGRVLSREDTRNATRAWMVAHVPAQQTVRSARTGRLRRVATRIVVEPVVPDGWAQDIGHPSSLTANGNRWSKFPTARAAVEDDGVTPVPGRGRVVNVEDYERTLRPALVAQYEREGYCWVVSGSTQRGRAEVDAAQVPQAIAYYAELERRGRLVHESSPFARGDHVPFDFDFSFDYAPRAYRRPGPIMQVYRLRGGQCAG